jgi:hypothetical protein
MIAGTNWTPGLEVFASQFEYAAPVDAYAFGHFLLKHLQSESSAPDMVPDGPRLRRNPDNGTSAVG